MNPNLYRNLQRDPGIPDGGQGGGDGAGGNGDSGAGSGASGNTGAAAGGAPARDYGRDIDSIRSELGGFKHFTQKFDDFHKDYQTRFGRQESRQDTNREPTPADFNGLKTQEDVLKFIDARSAYQADQRYESRRKAEKETESTSAAKARRSTNLQAHVGRMSEAMTRYKDFDTVINNAAMSNLPENITDDILESSHSADLQYHLSKNPGELYKVVNAYNTSERAGARMLGALEHKFEIDAATRKAALKKTRFSVTETVDSDIGGNASEEAENEDIARSSFKLKKK